MRLLALVLLAACAAEPSASVTITGSAAPHVDVVFRTGAREEVAKTGADGAYRIVVPAGTYRVFVRDDAALSVGRSDRVRLPGLPPAAAAGALDEALVPALTVTHDTTGVDLAVARGGIVTGTVFDVDARPVMGAVISAHTDDAVRPALRTDIAVSRYDGSFELRLPDGDYRLAASHPDFADATDVGSVDVHGGSRHVSLTLVKGCVIEGRVVGPDGAPAGEGAIERRFGASDLEFAPSGRIEPDGRFRWTTTDEREVVLRAWPWHASPSASKRFACRDGATFTATFTLPERAPDLSGTLVDRTGAPVPFTHLDVRPLDPGGIAQQERTDASGRWAVFALPPGRYQIAAIARGGVVTKVVRAPASGERLELSGTGRIEGTTTNLVHGSFELAQVACLDGGTLALPRAPRLVPVIGGRFTVDDLPACDLQLAIAWHGATLAARAAVPHGRAARVQLELGAPREKHVTGIVRDRAGHAVAGAHVTARVKLEAATAITDDDGRFELATAAGATIEVEHEGARGEASVGLANVPRERVDVVLNRR